MKITLIAVCITYFIWVVYYGDYSDGSKFVLIHALGQIFPPSVLRIIFILSCNIAGLCNFFATHTEHQHAVPGRLKGKVEYPIQICIQLDYDVTEIFELEKKNLMLSISSGMSKIGHRVMHMLSGLDLTR